MGMALECEKLEICIKLSYLREFPNVCRIEMIWLSYSKSCHSASYESTLCQHQIQQFISQLMFSFKQSIHICKDVNSLHVD